MRDNEIWFQFARGFVGRLRQEINGGIKFELFPEIDAVVIKTNFKEFTFRYAISNVQEIMMIGSVDEEVEKFMRQYRAAINAAFFKTEERKRRDNEEAWGLTNEEAWSLK